MNVAIYSYNRAEAICTHLLFKGYEDIFDYRILLHSEEQKAEYLKNPTIPAERLIVTGCPAGLPYQRQYAVEMYRGNDWWLSVDDNVERITTAQDMEADDIEGNVPKDWFGAVADPHTLLRALQRCIARAETTGAHYIGFAPVDNDFYRKSQWSDFGWAMGKMTLIKSGEPVFDKQIRVKDDYQFTAENLISYGSVVVNKWIRPIAAHYAPGGLGSQKAREPKSREDATRILKLYPGLFVVKDRPGRGWGTEILMTIRTAKGIRDWRKKMLQMRALNLLPLPERAE